MPGPSAKRIAKLRREIRCYQHAIDADLLMIGQLTHTRRTNVYAVRYAAYRAEIDEQIAALENRRDELDRSMFELEDELNQLLNPTQA